MPTYEYKCEDCDHRFEEFQNISDRPIHRCPQCGGPVRRLIGSGSGFLIKDRGFSPTGEKDRSASGCSLKNSGNTCCGRQERCDTPPCKE